MDVTSIAAFVAYWQRIHERTARVIGVIPPDRFEWRPVDAAFSFADLVRHLAAIERFMFAENVCGRGSAYPGHGSELADGTERVLEYYRRMHAEAVVMVSQLTDAELQLPCTTPGGATMTRAKWLRAMIEHEVHHRGQIYLMLKLAGVTTPPLYGLTSEQVRANSTPLAAQS
jgi:uncharacterized damage-inducible protein DinB